MSTESEGMCNRDKAKLNTENALLHKSIASTTGFGEFRRTGTTGKDSKRLSIYVYDLPGFSDIFYKYHSDLYKVKEECHNQIGERMLHQKLRNSSYTVTNPDKADLYYVPIYTGCYRTVIGRELKMNAYTATQNYIQEALKR